MEHGVEIMGSICVLVMTVSHRKWLN